MIQGSRVRESWLIIHAFILWPLPWPSILDPSAYLMISNRYMNTPRKSKSWNRIVLGSRLMAFMTIRNKSNSFTWIAPTALVQFGWTRSIYFHIVEKAIQYDVKIASLSIIFVVLVFELHFWQFENTDRRLFHIVVQTRGEVWTNTLNSWTNTLMQTEVIWHIFTN